MFGSADLAEWPPGTEACLLPLGFHFPRQILFSLLAQEFGRALAEFRIVRQSIEVISPQKIRAEWVFLERGQRQMDQRVPPVEIIGVLDFVLVHVRSNDQVSRLLLRGCVARIDGPLFWRQKPPAQQPAVIGILVHVRTKPRFEFEELVSRKHFDLAVLGNLFASEPNEKVSEPIWWWDTGQQYGREPRGTV
jgi:hypothetical protein